MTAFRMRWKRRRLLFRALRKRRQIVPVVDRTDRIAKGDILALATVRNEADRLPFFLDYHRKLGVSQFLIVDNDSNDGTTKLLREQPDVSVWHSSDSYKASRFGMDWLTWLQIRHCHGHWCLTLDADEQLVFPHCDTRGLPDLTRWLDERGARSFGATMLDLYPKGRLSEQDFTPGGDPTKTLQWFDAGNLETSCQPDLKNLLIRGGVRGRVFFGEQPERAPTLSKTPLVKWSRRYAYVSSTHSLLPPRLNAVRGHKARGLPSGVLLHSKFLPSVVERSKEEKARGEHFSNGALFDAYYDGLIADPDFWTEDSCRYEDWRQLENLGLMTRGDWH